MLFNVFVTSSKVSKHKSVFIIYQLMQNRKILVKYNADFQNVKHTNKNDIFTCEI